ncbi:hypothetical protein HanRHA438_Chr17g0827931 [Helianthus annuus]|nr:hypothetical protein HanRHA438_Chr17g0827931 [Helianthus annuus]
MRASSFTYQHVGLHTSLVFYIRSSSSPCEPDAPHMSTQVAIHACSFRYEHASLQASLLLHMQAC